jgi:hypothetical protein
MGLRDLLRQPLWSRMTADRNAKERTRVCHFAFWLSSYFVQAGRLWIRLDRAVLIYRRRLLVNDINRHFVDDVHFAHRRVLTVRTLRLNVDGAHREEAVARAFCRAGWRNAIC